MNLKTKTIQLMLKSAVCNTMKEELCIVLTTTDCQKTVQTIIETALERELAAVSKLCLFKAVINGKEVTPR